MPDTRPSAALPVVVIGAGPVGLAAAARLHAEGLPFVVLETGAVPAPAVREWGHVRLFTPWKHLVDDVARARLAAAGWCRPDGDVLPTGRELVEQYLEPLARLPELDRHIRYGTRVVRVGRRGLDKARTARRADAPFDVRIVAGDGVEGRLLARAVVDASGTFAAPNPLGAGGLPAPGEAAAHARIFYGLPDVLDRHRARYAGKRVAVVGSGHSAFNTLIDLILLRQADATRVTWLVRGTDLDRLWGGGEADQLTERGRLGLRMRELARSGQLDIVTGFGTDEVRLRDNTALLVAMDGREAGPFDEVIATTGFRPDLSLTRDLRLALDDVVEAPVRLAPLIDPNIHSCGTVPPHGYRELAHPEPDFYTVGMKSYGRAPTFLLLTGYEQVRSVVKALAGDLDAAGRVQLCLPGTGVCNTDLQPAPAAATGGA